MTKPVLCVIGTGGTIASRFDPVLGGHAAAVSAEELVAAVPRLDEIARIETISHSNINSALDTATAYRLRERRSAKSCASRAWRESWWKQVLVANVNEPFYEGIIAALDAGIPVVADTRVTTGKPHLGKGYRGSFMSLLAKGANSAGYMSGIEARIVLMVALGQARKRSELAQFFERTGGSF